MLLLAFGDYRRPADRPLQLVDDQHVYVCDVTARQRGAVEVGLGDGCHDDLAQKRAVVVPEVVVEILVVVGDLFLFGGIFYKLIFWTNIRLLIMFTTKISIGDGIFFS